MLTSQTIQENDKTERIVSCALNVQKHVQKMHYKCKKKYHEMRSVCSAFLESYRFMNETKYK